ncbi:cytosolic phospholipase A2 gamma-like isoform X2 [Pleurodeles waltl]|uniref:cytosolic phospholipase A2 gamma-like isoform X2 n=1 Tax=Pleurodeles waltl TaxID=8319 RepID=UPI00370978A8
MSLPKGRAADQRSSRGRCSAERFLPLLFILLLLKARNKQCLDTIENGTSAHIRWSKELSDGEKAATKKRKKFIAECLRRNSIKCDLDKVPCVALLGSGGGVRAMIALMGTLSELGRADLLDSIMYLCGVSGSTWCMSSVYEDINWSKNIKKCEDKLIEYLNKPSQTPLSVWQKIQLAIEEGVCSLTILWSYMVGNHMIKEINENNLSKHKGACENGANPYPIYAAVEKSNIINDKKNASGTWFEFTPHDAGFIDYGAFVNTEVIGSQFNNGGLATTKAEQTICYLRGLWGSALANEYEIKAYIKDYISSWFTGKHEEEEEDDTKMELQCLRSCAGGPAPYTVGEVAQFENPEHYIPVKCTCECCKAAEFIATLSVEELCSEAGQKELLRLEELLEECKMNGSHHMLPPAATPPASPPVEGREMAYFRVQSFIPSLVSSAYEKMVIMAKLMKSLVSWQWGTTHNYLYKCNTTDNPVPKELAEKEFINLIDAGLAINSAYPLVLRPERKVNLILSFDFSAGNPFETLKQTADYCKANKIPFPDIKVNKHEETKPSGCYVFKGPNVPTVVHIPLFNTENCAGEIQKYRDTFSTFKPSYGKDNVEDLLKVSKRNVQNNKNKILGELRKAVLP